MKHMNDKCAACVCWFNRRECAQPALVKVLQYLVYLAYELWTIGELYTGVINYS